MTKAKLRKNVKQPKKGKTLAPENEVVEEINKDEKKDEVLLNKEEKQLKYDGDKKDELLENNEQKEQQCLKNKLRNVFLKKDKLICTRLGRVVVLFFVTALTFGTRYYNLRQPKHVW